MRYLIWVPILLVSSISWAQHSPPTQHPNIPVVHTYRELQQEISLEPAFVIVTADECKATPYVMRHFAEHPDTFGKTKFVRLHVSGNFRPVPMLHFFGFPAIFYFEDGRPIDGTFGWQGLKSALPKFVPDFLNRTVHRAQNKKRKFVDVQEVIDLPEKTGVAVADKLNLVKAISKRSWYPLDLSEYDFSNVSIRNTDAFMGTNLTAANFENAELDRVSFFGADLSGASFKNATLTRMFWGNAICPDGTSALENGDTCEGHLQTH